MQRTYGTVTLSSEHWMGEAMATMQQSPTAVANSIRQATSKGKQVIIVRRQCTAVLMAKGLMTKVVQA